MPSLRSNCVTRVAAFGVAVYFVGGCGGENSAKIAEDPDASDSQAAAIESELAAAADSLASSQEEATACYETFKTCVTTATATADALATCKHQLTECLPDEPSLPRYCDGGQPPFPPPFAEVDADVPPNFGAGDVPTPYDGPGAPPPFAGGGFDADAGVPGALGEAHSRGRGRGRHHHMACGRPPLPPGQFGGCRESIAVSSAGTTVTVEEHRRCIGNVFGGYIAELCQKATSACTAPDAPQDACGRIAELCEADAGVDTSTVNVH